MDASFFFVTDDPTACDFHPERAHPGAWRQAHGLCAIECQFLWNVLRQDDDNPHLDGVTEFARDEGIWVWKFIDAFTQRLADLDDDAAAAVAKQIIRIPGIQGTSLRDAAKMLDALRLLAGQAQTGNQSLYFQEKPCPRI